MNVKGQLLLSVGTLIAGLLLYKRAKNNEFAAAVKKDDDEGIDPNWKSGAPIQSSGPVDTHDPHRPSCQVWDDDIQLFVNSGDVDSDNSQQVCWQKNDDSKQPRYVDKDGKISFRTDDPLSEPPGNRGICHFDSNGQDDTFPDIIAVAPPNRSERLCFAATGDPSEVPKWFINSASGKITFSPNYVAGDDPTLDLLSDFDAHPEAALGSYCEQQVPLVQSTINETINVWAPTTEVSTFSDVDSCLNHPSQVPIRFHNKKTKQLVYKNPFTGEKIMTSYE